MTDETHFDDTTISDAFAEVHTEVGMLSLDAAIRELASARGGLALCKIVVGDARARWEADNATMLAELKAAQEHVNEAERAVRIAGMAAYAQSGDKKPHPAVQIKLTKAVAFNEADARQWALDHIPTLVRLDTSAFEKVARTGTLPKEVAQVEEVPQVTISTDLSAWLESEE